MDNDETHYPSASAEAIRAYYDVRDWEAWPKCKVPIRSGNV